MGISYWAENSTSRSPLPTAPTLVLKLLEFPTFSSVLGASFWASLGLVLSLQNSQIPQSFACHLGPSSIQLSRWVLCIVTAVLVPMCLLGSCLHQTFLLTGLCS